MYIFQTFYVKISFLFIKENYHGLISEKDDSYYLKFKIYLDTGLFDANKKRFFTGRDTYGVSENIKSYFNYEILIIY